MASRKHGKKKQNDRQPDRSARLDVVEQVTTHQDSTGKALSLPTGAVDLGAIDTRGTPIGPRDKAEAKKLMAELAPELAALQEKLVAEAIRGGRRRVLLILQGMDTSGKDGVVKHVLGLVNPAGVHLTSFKKPSAEELRHDFLWRISAQVPQAGQIGVFNRSQYEDVIVPRVHCTVARPIIASRYEQINDFERMLVQNNVIVLKFFLHISRGEQRKRLLKRIEEPKKNWKFREGDVDERKLWDDYTEAYRDMLTRCSMPEAPWYVVPSDDKPVRDYLIAGTVARTMKRLKLRYPEADPNVLLRAEQSLC